MRVLVFTLAAAAIVGAATASARPAPAPTFEGQAIMGDDPGTQILRIVDGKAESQC